MSSYQEFKTFYLSNIILFIILIFVIFYLIINWENVSNGKYLSGEFVKPILFTGILFLIIHMIITWDDNTQYHDNDLIIPKYKLGRDSGNAQQDIIAAATLNLPNQNPNLNSNPQSLNSKYRIINKFDIQQPLQNPTLGQFEQIGQNLSNIHSDINKMSNQNIFISQKNSSKYGLKFQ